MLKYIINLLFPPRCIFCRSIINIENRTDVCDLCYKKIPFANKIIRPEAGQYFDRAICVCEYSGIIKEAIIRYKFFNKQYYHKAFALLLAGKIRKMTTDSNFDIIISVPLHRSKLALRGYNQSLLISKTVSKEIGLEEKSYTLSRIKQTESQSTLPKSERLSNVGNAFKVLKPHEINGKKILLVDDVLTTGNTLSECSRVLKESGAVEVVAAVIASGKKY